MAFLRDEPGAESVSEILGELTGSASKGYMSVASWGVVCCNLFQSQGKEAAEKKIAQIKCFPLKLVDITCALACEAAKIKRESCMDYEDCLSAALARELDATLVTGNWKFKQLEKTVPIQWIAPLHKPDIRLPLFFL